MPQVGFEPTISAGERPQTYALDRAATGTGISLITNVYYKKTTWNTNICNCNITINTLHKILETNLSNGKKRMFVFHVVFM